MKGPALDGAGGVGVEVGTPLFQTVHLPSQVTDVPREVVRAFSHNKRVGTYLLGRSLGEGSFAKVKEALHLPTGEKVAIKVIDKKRAKADPYVRKNLRREGRLLQQIRHQHVVQLLEVLETEHSYYLVTEYCAGGDLMDHIAKRKKLDEKEVKKFIRQIVSGVDYLHRLGIIHRDLKIENLLLDQNKDIKLIDFGLSNTIKVSTAPEGTAHAQEYLVTQCGSPAYAAPELLNHKKYGLQVDLWSIGVNMYAMLTGALPFTVDPFNIKTLHNKMVSGQMNPIPEGLSREGKDILRRFLTSDPEKRITIAEALRHPWLAEGRNKPLERHPFPNKLKTSELDMDILKHMSDNLGYRMSEIIRFVVGNVPSSACSTYHLYHRKLQRHRAEQRAQGKSPADAKHVEPTRISLVLQDMTPRVTNTSVPARPMRMRGDSFDKEAGLSHDTHVINGRRLSLEKARTANTTPSTDKDSVPSKEKTFLSSMEHSLEDMTKENRQHRKTSDSSSKQDSPGGSPKLASSPTKASIKASHIYNMVNMLHKAEQDKGGKISTPKATFLSPAATAPSTPHAHMIADCGRKGRVLVPLNRTFTPLRKAMRGTVVVGIHHQYHHEPPLSPGSSHGYQPHPEKGVSPRVDGSRLLRATYPANSVLLAGSSPPPTPSGLGHLSRQPPVVKRVVHAQWRSAQRTEEHPDTSRLAPKDATEGKRPVSPQAQPLVRRRLVKRSRQEDHGHLPDGQGDDDMMAQMVEESVERLATSPDCRVAKTPVSQSAASSVTRDSHLFPAISTAGTPRNS